MIKIFICLLTLILQQTLLSTEICGRTATINYQEVLIDTNPLKKGEGLRSYLQKDEEALKLFNHYQGESAPQWKGAVVGTIGTGLIIAGLTKSGPIFEGRNKVKRYLIFAGLSVLLVNYLITKASEYQNEQLLLRSIEEYNKRNLPQIYLAPYSESGSPAGDTGISAGFIKEF